MERQLMLMNLERRISYHMQDAYANILEVGRCLIEAKEGGLVPHGEWETWVKRTTGMSERRAQRLMQAAREVSPDSAMARLPISKISAILALPASEREAVAQKAVETDMPLRELEKQVEGLRRQVRQADDARVTAIRKATTLAEEKRRVERMLATTQKDLETAIGEMESAKARPTGISEEAQTEIHRLEGELEEAQRMAARQADLRQQAQQELLNMKSQAARGEPAAAEDLTAEAVAMAVRTFIGCVGYVPYAGMRLAKLSRQEQEQLESYVQMLDRWVRDTRQALSDVGAAVVIREAEAWAK